jgi:putative transposase
MTQGLKRYYGSGHLHYITFSCFQRRPVLGSARRRDLCLEMLEQTRRSYRFVVVAYVVMPEQVHLLIDEPERGTPSTVLQVVKQRFAHRLLREFVQFAKAHPSKIAKGGATRS